MGSEREEKSLQVIKRYVGWSVGISLIPIPLLDLAANPCVQLKMLSEISKIYGTPIRNNGGKVAAGSLLGGTFPNLAVGMCANYLDALLGGAFYSLLEAVPLLNLAVAAHIAVLSGATTWALGKVFIQHFESGGTFLDFNSAEVKETFRAQFVEGRTMIENMGARGKAEVPA